MGQVGRIIHYALPLELTKSAASWVEDSDPHTFCSIPILICVSTKLKQKNTIDNCPLGDLHGSFEKKKPSFDFARSNRKVHPQNPTSTTTAAFLHTFSWVSSRNSIHRCLLGDRDIPSGSSANGGQRPGHGTSTAPRCTRPPPAVDIGGLHSVGAPKPPT